MGSCMKFSIFDEQTSKVLKKWHMAVKKRQRGGRGPKPPTVTLGRSSTVSKVHSSGHRLHRFKTTGHSTSSSIYDDPKTSDNESDLMYPTSTTNLIIRAHQDLDETEINESHSREQDTRSEDDFTFVTPAPPK